MVATRGRVKSSRGISNYKKLCRRFAGIFVTVSRFELTEQTTGSFPVLVIWGFPKIRGTFLVGPLLRMIVFWGTILRSPYFGKLPFRDCLLMRAFNSSSRIFLPTATAVQYTPTARPKVQIRYWSRSLEICCYKTQQKMPGR